MAHRTIEERVGLWRKFYDRTNERPLFGFFVGSEYPVRRYRAAQALPEGRPLVPSDFDVESFLDDHDRIFAEHEACGGDFIWAADAYWGIQWIECLCGLDMYCNHESGNLHFRNPVEFKGSQDIPEFDPAGPWMRLAEEFLVKGAARAAGRYPFGTTRMRGISDMLSALYGGQDFIYALMDRPDEVAEVCRKVTAVYTAFARFQIERIPLFHGGVGSFYYSNWAPAGTVWHQEDAAAMLSPDLYREHIEPWDRALVAACGHNIMHMHSTGFIPLDRYLDMDFTAMELHIDMGGPSAESLFETHGRILERKPLLIWGDIPERDLEWIFSRLPPQGLAVNTVVDSAERAHQLYGRFLSARKSSGGYDA